LELVASVKQERVGLGFACLINHSLETRDATITFTFCDLLLVAVGTVLVELVKVGVDVVRVEE
jgi:hypothetical protein